MSTYSTPIDISSYFVGKQCLKDDVAEYATEQEYRDCYMQRTRVKAVLFALVIVAIAGIVFYMATLPESEIPMYAGGVVLGVGALLVAGSYFWAGRSAAVMWGQNEGELDLLKKKYKTLNPSNTDEQNEIMARDEQRNIQQNTRLIRAQENMARAQSRAAMSQGLMGLGLLAGRR